MDRGKAVAAGHICLDITPVFPDGEKRPIGEVISPGKLLHMAGVDVHTGGSVANTGLAMRRLGMDVRLMGKVGDDEFGRMVLQMLGREDADRGMIISQGSRTSYSVVLAVPGNDRVFLHDCGANEEFFCRDLDFDEIAGADIFHFGYPPLMRSLYADGGEELAGIFRRVDELGVLTSLDMASVDPSSAAGRADWQAILEKTLPYVDFFVPSVEELAFMLDRELYDELNRRAVGREVTEVLDIEAEVRPLALRAAKLGASLVLVKCGARGMYVCTTDTAADDLNRKARCPGRFDGWSGRHGFVPSFRPDKVRSATGAGDASIAAFLTAAVGDYPLERCLELAAATGASCVETYDALSGLRSFDELEEKIRGGWARQG